MSCGVTAGEHLDSCVLMLCSARAPSILLRLHLSRKFSLCVGLLVQTVLLEEGPAPYLGLKQNLFKELGSNGEPTGKEFLHLSKKFEYIHEM